MRVLLSPAGHGLAINPHKGKRHANPPAGFVQRAFFTHRGILCCLSPARRRDARKSPLHYQTGPGPAGTSGGVAGAERTTRTASLIRQPGQSSATILHRRPRGSQDASCRVRPAGAESNPETGTDY